MPIRIVGCCKAFHAFQENQINISLVTWWKSFFRLFALHMNLCSPLQLGFLRAVHVFTWTQLVTEWSTQTSVVCLLLFRVRENCSQIDPSDKSTKQIVTVFGQPHNQFDVVVTIYRITALLRLLRRKQKKNSLWSKWMSHQLSTVKMKLSVPKEYSEALRLFPDETKLFTRSVWCMGSRGSSYCPSFWMGRLVVCLVIRWNGVAIAQIAFLWQSGIIKF